MNRRAFLALGGAAAASVALGGVALRGRAPALRVGVMANLTHAPLLAGLGSGRISRALAPLAVETRLFRAGPRVMEALLGDAIDVGTSGPAAVVVHHSRHVGGAGAVRVLGGCASGGASLVVAKNADVARAEDLRGKRVAVTQLGTTQDVALRGWLAASGLRDKAAGGDVTILAIDGATILEQMRRGELHAAWMAEPWATRLVVDLGATRLVDERDLWDGHRFATAILVAPARRAEEPAIATLRSLLADEVDRALRDQAATRAEAYAELKRHVGNPGSRAVFDRAWGFVDFTNDPIRSSVERFADSAVALGLCPRGAAEGLFDRV